MSQPVSGSMVYWRYIGDTPRPWNLGYCTHEKGRGLARMGRWKDDIRGGVIVSMSEIQWRAYKND